ncbi:MAG TPA: helix-hairpin-helix domain-containing protein [Polyangiaceae bacterium]|nr:helix-hairpin-helix domain-containing protein [Polyangiaceae bacterium]
MTDRERLLFIRGVGQRTVTLLEEAGYRTVEDVLREDIDRLAIRTGLGIKKARLIKQGAQYFVESEQKVLDDARQEAKRVAEDAASQPPKQQEH